MATDALSLSELCSRLVEALPDRRSGLAAQLGVSVPTLSRWIAGKSRPRPDMERRLRRLGEQRLVVGSSSLLFEPSSADAARQSLAALFASIREALHRHSRLSSRHELLDVVSRLLAAHVVDIEDGQHGLTSAVYQQESGAPHSIRTFVQGTLERRAGVSHDPSVFNGQPLIGDDEETLAHELVDAFEQHLPASLFRDIERAGELDLLNDAFGQFMADSFADEKELGQYLTPPEIVRFMTIAALDLMRGSEALDALADPAGDGILLDPSCGVGSFLSEAVRQLGRQAIIGGSPDELDRWRHSALSSRVVGIDKSDRMIRLAYTSMVLYGEPSVRLMNANGLQLTEDIKPLLGRTSLILTNPPFGAEFTGKAIAEFAIGTKPSGERRSRVDSELLFMERYLQWLRPGGLLGVVVPDSILANKGVYRDLREQLRPDVELEAVVSLPAVTFAASGTSTKTSALFLRRSSPSPERRTVFAVASEVGFDVVTRGSQRRRIAKSANDLPTVLEAIRGSNDHLAQAVEAECASADRWDPGFYCSVSPELEASLSDGSRGTLLESVACLVREKENPKRRTGSTFPYIEISDVDGRRCTVSAKDVPCASPPSRARRPVKAGDVLVATVRPERRVIGVVPPSLDGAICTTGFAVLRATGISPLLLARLLQSDAVNAQLMRHNVGVAYPAIPEDCLPGVVLPISGEHLGELSVAADEAWATLAAAQQKIDGVTKEIHRAAQDWLS